MVTIVEIDKAFVKREEKRPSRCKSEGSMFPTTSRARRGTVAGGQQTSGQHTSAVTAASLTSTRPARSVTPTQTVKRRTVTGPPQEARRSLLQHMSEDKLIRDEALLQPRTEHVLGHSGDMRPSLLCPEIPKDFKWDTRACRFRSDIGSPTNFIGGNEVVGPTLHADAVEALKEPRERKIMLVLEDQFIAGLQDPSIDRIELTNPIPADLKGLVKNVSDYYGLECIEEETDDQKASRLAGGDEMVTMTLVRTPDSKIPAESLADMVEEQDLEDSDGEDKEKTSNSTGSKGTKTPSKTGDTK